MRQVLVLGAVITGSSGCNGVLEQVNLRELDDLPTLDELTALIPFEWPESPIPLQHDLGEPGELAAAALGQRIVHGRFPAEFVDECEDYAPYFTWLAARAEEPVVIEASLRAMGSCTDHIHPPDGRAVAASRLNHEVDAVASGALALALPLTAAAPVHGPLVEALVHKATDSRDMGTRIAALEVLDERAWSQEPAVADAFYAALQAEYKPPLTATALECLAYRSSGMPANERHRFLFAAMLLVDDIDPGIRGFSALALARLDPDDEDVRARILSLLDDRHAYTRSAAADALADMGYLPAVHELMDRLGDQEPNVWRMLPYTRPDGQRARRTFRGSHFARVDDAYLRALERMTSALEEPFVYRDVNLRFKDLDIVAATRDAATWYEAYGTHLPRRGVADGGAIGQGDASELEVEP